MKGYKHYCIQTGKPCGTPCHHKCPLYGQDIKVSFNGDREAFKNKKFAEAFSNLVHLAYNKSIQK